MSEKVKVKSSWLGRLLKSKLVIAYLDATDTDRVEMLIKQQPKKDGSFNIQIDIEDLKKAQEDNRKGLKALKEIIHLIVYGLGAVTLLFTIIAQLHSLFQYWGMR